MAATNSFSDGETFALFFGLIFGAVPCLAWYKALLFHGKFGAPKYQRMALYLVPALGLLLLQFVLVQYADPVVRGDRDYQWLFLLLALVWINAARFLTPFLGISITSDVIERNNSAAVIALAGAFASVLIVYGGSNIGSGPTIATTLVPAFLGTLALFGFWLVLELVCHPSTAITEDRDLATGIRLAGFLLAIAVIFGYAMAGDWISLEDTFLDLGRHGWPAITVLLIAVTLEKKLKPDPTMPRPSIPTHGLLPFAAEVLISIASIIYVRG